MKNLFLAPAVILIILAISSLVLAYNLGKRAGLNTYEYSVKQDVAKRYMDIFGNPSTKTEQCNFDYVIYGDTSECR